MANRTESYEGKARLHPVCPSSKFRRFCFLHRFSATGIIPLLSYIIMATCYIAEGADMPEFVPCNTTASVSLCCLPGQICLSNGYCSTQYGQIYSGACTDPTYSSSICPELCTMGIPLAQEFRHFSLTFEQQLVVTLLDAKGLLLRMRGSAAACTATEVVATIPKTSCTWPLQYPLQLL